MSKFLRHVRLDGLDALFRSTTGVVRARENPQMRSSGTAMHKIDELAATNVVAASEGRLGGFWRPYLPFAWLALAGTALTVDYLTGPIIQFPVTYLLPIGLAAWSGHSRLAYLLAAAMPAARVGFSMIWETPWSPADACVNGAIRMVVLLVVAYLIHRTASRTAALKQEVRFLKGLLPICSYCKSIRDREGVWHSIEGYVSSHSEVTFSHGLCPECLEKHYGGI